MINLITIFEIKVLGKLLFKQLIPAQSSQKDIIIQVTSGALRVGVPLALESSAGGGHGLGKDQALSVCIRVLSGRVQSVNYMSNLIESHVGCAIKRY